MKYEIIIEPEDHQHCGKCTYLGSKYRAIFDAHMAMEFWECCLFKERLNSAVEKPKRCGDCIILCETFSKLPELDEV